MRGKKIMKKYKNVIELIYDYVNKKINYDEYLKQLCILTVGEDNYDKYELYKHLYKLYVYTKDNKIYSIDKVFGEKKDSTLLKLFIDFYEDKISFEEYTRRYCEVVVGVYRFDFYDLAEHDLYIYCTDDTVEVIEDYY